MADPALRAHGLAAEPVAVWESRVGRFERSTRELGITSAVLAPGEDLVV